MATSVNWGNPMALNVDLLLPYGSIAYLSLITKVGSKGDDDQV